MTNQLLTKMIIALHENGFTDDFFVHDASDILGSVLSPGTIYPFFTVVLINQVFDELTNTYKYIHAIETICGRKGLLLSADLLFHTNNLVGPYDQTENMDLEYCS